MNCHVFDKISSVFDQLEIGTAVYFARYDHVTNLEQLLCKEVQDEAAIVDADLIASQSQVLATVYKALAAKLTGKQKLRSLNAEIIFNLAVNNNISQSLKTFGIQNLIEQKKYSIVVICIGNESQVPSVFAKIQGQMTKIENGDHISPNFEKIYKSRDVCLVTSKIAAKSFL